MLRLLTTLFLVCSTLAGVQAEEAQRVFRVGVTAFRDKAVTVQEWQPTADFLSANIPGSRFEVVPMNMPEFEDALRAKTLDFLITNPQHYISVESRYRVSRAATLVKSENGQIVNKFGGVMFTRADRTDINDIEHLRGKRVAATDKTSFAAYLIQADLMLEHGINPDADCQMSYLGFPQDLSVKAVLEGKADVGFARSGLIESMAREGKLDLATLKIIHPLHQDDFPFKVSSELYPEWPFAVAPHVPIDITNRVAAALLLMPANAPAANIGRYYRWSTPVEYLSVQALMQRRHVYPFDKPEHVSLRTIAREYSTPIIVCTLSVALLLALLYWRTFRLNRELLQSRQALSNMAHFDALTGLPNRHLLDDRVAQVLAHRRREPHSIALCVLDLDGFKPINDQYGHDVGDKVLTEVANRLKTAVRECDTVARFGGDEFVLLLNDFGTEATLTDILDRVVTAVAQPMQCCPQAKVSASIGFSIYGVDAQDATTLFRHADEAMYQAKAAGGSHHVRYRVT